MITTAIENEMGVAPLVSVIVPVYNVEDYLGECIESLLSQSMTDFEIICVDDGSTDGSSAILDDFAKRDRRIRVFTQKNAGLPSARNLGLSQIKGEFICFVDADDGLAPNALKKIYRAGRENDADIVIFGFKTNRYPLYEKISTWYKYQNPVRNIVYYRFEPDALFAEPGAMPFVCRNCYRRALLEENNLTFWQDCRFGEDIIFQMQAFPKAHNITFIKDKLYYYRCSRPESLMNKYNRNQNLKADSHIQVVSHMSNVYENDIFKNMETATGAAMKTGMEATLGATMRTMFAEWAIDFVYGQWVNADEEEKPLLAGRFIDVMKKVLSEDQMQRLSSRTRVRYDSIKRLV